MDARLKIKCCKFGAFVSLTPVCDTQTDRFEVLKFMKNYVHFVKRCQGRLLCNEYLSKLSQDPRAKVRLKAVRRNKL
jgi:hypothetical protein